MGILDKWLDDLPQQFQGKKYIEALISVFAKQLEDLYKVFKQLDTETDLDSAVGMNLDMVGDIVTLTRKEAGVLAGIDVEDPVISDERYRQFLKYQMLVNTNECTYRDLMDGLALLWDVSGSACGDYTYDAIPYTGRQSCYIGRGSNGKACGCQN